MYRTHQSCCIDDGGGERNIRTALKRPAIMPSHTRRADPSKASPTPKHSRAYMCHRLPSLSWQLRIHAVGEPPTGDMKRSF
jgi:hypothetical protein